MKKASQPLLNWGNEYLRECQYALEISEQAGLWNNAYLQTGDKTKDMAITSNMEILEVTIKGRTWSFPRKEFDMLPSSVTLPAGPILSCWWRLWFELCDCWFESVCCCGLLFCCCCCCCCCCCWCIWAIFNYMQAKPFRLQGHIQMLMKDYLTIKLAPWLAYLYLHEAEGGHQQVKVSQHWKPHHQQNLRGHPFQDSYSDYSKAF